MLRSAAQPEERLSLKQELDLQKARQSGKSGKSRKLSSVILKLNRMNKQKQLLAQAKDRRSSRPEVAVPEQGPQRQEGPDQSGRQHGITTGRIPKNAQPQTHVKHVYIADAVLSRDQKLGLQERRLTLTAAAHKANVIIVDRLSAMPVDAKLAACLTGAAVSTPSFLQLGTGTPLIRFYPAPKIRHLYLWFSATLKDCRFRGPRVALITRIAEQDGSLWTVLSSRADWEGWCPTRPTQCFAVYEDQELSQFPSESRPRFGIGWSDFLHGCARTCSAASMAGTG